jgi:lambda repressor-like predicted transcriptional regulator
MTTTTRSRGIDPELMTSRMFAQVFQAYMECSEDVQGVIRDMAEIVNDPSSTEDEKLMACATIGAALFPSHNGGHLGVDLEEAERVELHRSRQLEEIHAAMDLEEVHFADRVQNLMKARDITQADLAEACEIGQPAISNLLSRRSRPQRRTVDKIAKALGVSPDEIWPE